MRLILLVVLVAFVALSSCKSNAYQPRVGEEEIIECPGSSYFIVEPSSGTEFVCERSALEPEVYFHDPTLADTNLIGASADFDEHQTTLIILKKFEKRKRWILQEVWEVDWSEHKECIFDPFIQMDQCDANTLIWKRNQQ